jgi:hypothetical protein
VIGGGGAPQLAAIKRVGLPGGGCSLCCQMIRIRPQIVPLRGLATWLSAGGCGVWSMPHRGRVTDQAVWPDGRRFGTADGWSVEAVRLSMTPDRHDGEWLRARRFGFWIADVRAVEDLARYFRLADLQPDRLFVAGL